MNNDELFNKAFGTEAPETQTSPVPSEGDALFEKAFGSNQDRYNQSKVQAQDAKPEQTAEALKLSKDYGVDLDFAERNLEFFKEENKRKAISYDNVSEKSKRVSTLFEDPKNFKLGKDAVEPLSKLDAQLSRMTKYDDSPSYFSNLAHAYGTGRRNLEASERSLYAAFGMVDTVNNDEYFENLATLNKEITDRQNKQPKYVEEFNKFFDKEWGDVTKSAEGFALAKESFEEGEILEGLKNVGKGIWSAAEFVDVVGGIVSRPRAAVQMATESVPYVLPSAALS